MSAPIDWEALGKELLYDHDQDHEAEPEQVQKFLKLINQALALGRQNGITEAAELFDERSSKSAARAREDERTMHLERARGEYQLANEHRENARDIRSLGWR